MEACVSSSKIPTKQQSTNLHSFGISTGLKVNYAKSSMVPINISEQELDHLARTFNCAKGSLPFTYLGLLLGLTKPRVVDFSPLVNKCERRLVTEHEFCSDDPLGQKVK